MYVAQAAQRLVAGTTMMRFDLALILLIAMCHPTMRRPTMRRPVLRRPVLRRVQPVAPRCTSSLRSASRPLTATLHAILLAEVRRPTFLTGKETKAARVRAHGGARPVGDAVQ